MHFGEALSEDRLEKLTRQAFDDGVRTFMTADTYGTGRADEMLGRALSGVDRDDYCLIGLVGHDIYDGDRVGARGYARFTHPELRGEDGYAEYLQRATQKMAERCQTDHFDVVMLHNPDEIGYTSPAVWEAMQGLKDSSLTSLTGIAPGPANGFAMDMGYAMQHFHEQIDWAMIILNPNEPWPGRTMLPMANEYGVDLVTRVVDYGGIFHDDVKPGHFFKEGDHRTYRAEGWVESGCEKIEKMREVAKKYEVTMLQLACLYNLSQAPVKSTAPTFIQEAGEGARPVEEKVTEFANLPTDIVLTNDEIELLSAIGNNVGCMQLKGASERNDGEEPQPDRWPMRPDLAPVADRWSLNPAW